MAPQRPSDLIFAQFGTLRIRDVRLVRPSEKPIRLFDWDIEVGFSQSAMYFFFTYELMGIRVDST